MSNNNNIQDTNGGIVVVVGEGCFSEEEQFYSTYDDDDDDDDDDDEDEGHEIERRLSDCSVIMDVVTSTIHPYNDEVVILVNNNNKDCRICHMSLDDKDDDDAIELGCCCKNDLAAAHKHCALTWFKIKGNKICEICNSIVTNLVVPNDMSSVHGTIDANPVETSVAVTHMSTSGRRGRRGGEGGCINGHRLLNFILACLVFAFVISWLFHFNIPS